MRWMFVLALLALPTLGCSGSETDSTTPGGGGSAGAGGTGGGGDGAKCEAKPQDWKAISDTGAPTGQRELTWTGSEMYSERTGDESALYDPCTDTWRARATPPVATYQLPSKRVAMDNGFEYYSFDESAAVLYRYDFVANTWATHSSDGAQLAAAPTVVSLGDGLVAWSGSRKTQNGAYEDVPDGAVFDATQSQWHPMTSNGAPQPRTAGPAVWTGKYVAIWGGMVGKTVDSPYSGTLNCWSQESDSCERLGDGALYDPSADSWTPISNEGAPAPRSRHVLAWTGQKLLVWGGVSYAAPGAADPQYTQFGDGASYDPETSTWAPMAPFPGQPDILGDTRFFVRGRLLVFQKASIVGYSYDPTSDAWTPIADPPVELHCASQRLRAQAGMIVDICNDESLAARYDPVKNEWLVTALPASDAVLRSLLWTGQRLFVQGGQVMGEPTGCGPGSPPGCDPYVMPTPVGDGAMLIP